MFFAAGVFCLIYYLVICRYVGRWNATFSRFWLICGGFCIFYGAVQKQLPKEAEWMVLAVWTVFWLAVISVWIRMLAFRRQKSVGRLQYLIVLGARVDGTRITSSLKLRLDRACTYAHRDGDVQVVVSGGQGKGEDLSEAEAMAKYLICHGIERDRIILEDRSSTTQENLRFTACIVPEIREKSTGIVTNSFHSYRAWLLGRQEGYRVLSSVPARSEPVLFLNYLLREALAVLVLPIKSRRNRH